VEISRAFEFIHHFLYMLLFLCCRPRKFMDKKFLEVIGFSIYEDGKGSAHDLIDIKSTLRRKNVI
jgi:hypothetical protein